MAAWADALHLPPAGPSEVLLASHKDAAHSGALADQVVAALSGLLGPQRSQAWKRELSASAVLLYYALTSGRGRQTPGEEYSDLTLVRASDGLAASRAKRWVALALHVLVPLALQRSCARLVIAARRCEEEGDGSHWLLRMAAPRLQELVDACERLHRAVFVVRGSVLLLSHRFAGLRHVRHSAFSPPSTSIAGVGVLLLLQLALDLTSYLRRAFLNRRHARLTARSAGSSATPEVPPSPQARICSLCLGQRRHPSLAPCGHVYCWSCLHEWLADKRECPLCRKECAPQSVRCLQRYY